MFLPEISDLQAGISISGTVLTTDKSLVEQVETRSAFSVFGSGGECRQELEAQHSRDENICRSKKNKRILGPRISQEKTGICVNFSNMICL